ncbi:MAG: hypothetical protein JJT76_06535 [Clostridiaceae bacterium]|nr:hypothetical protein [Clostridiaceae bacterium]
MSISNRGFVKIYLREVVINDGERPKNVEVGGSRTSHMVLGGGLVEDPYITFHDIGELFIYPELTEEAKEELFRSKRTNTIIHSGIRIYNDEPIEKITSNYRYFRIPFTLEKKGMLQ